MKYDRTAVILHWVIGLAIVGQFALGILMQEVPKGGDGARAWWFNLHKSIGITLGALVVFRLLWRLTHAAPSLPRVMPAWQRTAASLAHYGLYVCMLALPASGFLGSVFSGYRIRVFGLPLPQMGSAWPSAKHLMAAVHETAAWTFAVIVGVHIAASVWHLVRQDGVFRRMWV